MDDKVKGLQEALANFLRVGSCRSRSGPVAMDAEPCADEQCVGCGGRAALRAYELSAADRFRDWLSIRACLDAAEEMAACLRLYQQHLSNLGGPDTDAAEEWLTNDAGTLASDVLDAYSNVQKLASGGEKRP
jgi:hypothetical protein